MAVASDESRQRCAQQGRLPERRTDRTITDPRSLRCELDRAHADGYAIETGEAVAGMRGVAAPIVQSGETVAALQVTGVEVDEYVARLVVRTAREFLGRRWRRGRTRS
jgi:DNA-binding IclR family transcriptional regulator